MVRECVTALLIAASSGCSLILDFDSAPPVDAAIDGISTMAECDYLEPNGSVADAKDMPDGMSAGPAAICAVSAGTPEDHDFYKFTATGATATIALTFTNRPGGDLDLKLYAMDGTLVAQSRSFGAGETLVCPGSTPLCPMLSAARYIVEVLPGVAGSVNTYSVTVTQ
jgi:hypothetical protein